VVEMASMSSGWSRGQVLGSGRDGLWLARTCCWGMEDRRSADTSALAAAGQRRLLDWLCRPALGRAAGRMPALFRRHCRTRREGFRLPWSMRRLALRHAI